MSIFCGKWFILENRPIISKLMILIVLILKRTLIVAHFGGFWTYPFLGTVTTFQRALLFTSAFPISAFFYKLGEQLNGYFRSRTRYRKSWIASKFKSSILVCFTTTKLSLFRLYFTHLFIKNYYRTEYEINGFLIWRF